MPTIQHREWLWAAAWSVVITLLALAPYLYGALASGPTHQFSGFTIGLEDGNSYAAKMQEGRAGYWLFYLAYTPEPHRGELFFSYYLLLGKLAGLLNLPNVVMLHLSKAATIPLSLLASYYFMACFTPHTRVRQIAFLILGFSGGLGWLWLVLGGSAQLGQMPVDLWVPDASFFLAALTFPHLPLAQGLLLLFSVACLDFMQTGRKLGGLAAAGCGLAVSLIHPYTLPIIGTVFGLYLLWQFWQHGTSPIFGEWDRLKSLSEQPKKAVPQIGVRYPWRQAIRLLLVTLPSLPYLLYVGWVFQANFAFVAWREQSLTYSPVPLHYLLGFGLTLALALLGLWVSRRRSDDNFLFVRIWILSVPLLLYAPLALQRRFLDGYQAPLALLAALGLAWLLEHPPFKYRCGLFLALALLLMSLTNVLLLVGSFVTIDRQPEAVFIPAGEAAAAAWLGQQEGAGVVLAAYPTGNYLPTVATVRVFVGHGPETVNSDEKRKLVKTFFDSATSDEWRRGLLQKYGVNYLYYGPAERATGAFSPGQAAYLKLVYENEVVKIFKVILP